MRRPDRCARAHSESDGKHQRNFSHSPAGRFLDPLADAARLHVHAGAEEADDEAERRGVEERTRRRREQRGADVAPQVERSDDHSEFEKEEANGA